MSQSIWECKVGGDIESLPFGADAPMREAIKKAYYELTGHHAEFLFSGWGATLTDTERAVVETARRLRETEQ